MCNENWRTSKLQMNTKYTLQVSDLHTFNDLAQFDPASKEGRNN